MPAGPTPGHASKPMKVEMREPWGRVGLPSGPRWYMKPLTTSMPRFTGVLYVPSFRLILGIFVFFSTYTL